MPVVIKRSVEGMHCSGAHLSAYADPVEHSQCGEVPGSSSSSCGTSERDAPDWLHDESLWRDGRCNHETKHAEFPQTQNIDKVVCGYACGDAVTGPSDSDGFEDCRKSRPTRRPSKLGSLQSSVHIDKVVVGTAYGDAATGPSYSDGVEDHGNPDHGAVRRQTYGGADGMRQVACPQTATASTRLLSSTAHVVNVASTATSENVPHAFGFACTRCTEAAQSAKLPRRKDIDVERGASLALVRERRCRW